MLQDCIKVSPCRRVHARSVYQLRLPHVSSRVNASSFIVGPAGGGRAHSSSSASRALRRAWPTPRIIRHHLRTYRDTQRGAGARRKEKKKDHGVKKRRGARSAPPESNCLLALVPRNPLLHSGPFRTTCALIAICACHPRINLRGLRSFYFELIGLLSTYRASLCIPALIWHSLWISLGSRSWQVRSPQRGPSCRCS